MKSQGQFPGDPITIIDPLNYLNNTSRSTFRIKEIQNLFREAYFFLARKVREDRQDVIK